MKKNKSNFVSAEHHANGPERLSSSMAPLVKKILGPRGLAEIEILENWEKIIGPELARFSCPQKIDFSKDSRCEGTLHLMAASGAYALEIQHKTELILERINTFFGYRAVSALKIIQNDTFMQQTADSVKNDDKTDKKLVTGEEQNYIGKITEQIADPKLKERLQSLGLSILKNSK